MTSRDLTLISVSTFCGFLSSFLAFHFISSRNPKKTLISKQIPIHAKPVDRDPFDPSKRNDYLSWDDYFMAIAFLSAERSKDPNRQVGACLVSENGVILGIGYNGFPRGCSDEKLPWAKKSIKGDPLETKFPYVVHAEVNAILNTNHASAAGQRLYVTMFPCNECAKVIIQAGVSEVIYFIDKMIGSSDPKYAASHKLLSMANVKIRRHQPQLNKLTVSFEEPCR